MNGELASVELENFQKHSKIKVDFTNGINVLVGASASGKSCIRRAITWCLFKEAIDGVRKEGTKTTSVKITLTNGNIIERIRTSSINRYVLIVNGKESTFDSIGKTLPQEIKDAVGINPMIVDGEELWLNSAPQIALPFLFDRSPAWRMKLFNQLTGNDLLDKLFAQFNKDILRISREHKSDTERLETKGKELETKEIEKEQLEAVHSIVKKQIEGLRKKQAEYDKLLTLLELQESNETLTNTLKAKKAGFKCPKDTEIKELTAKIDDLDEKEKLLTALVRNKDEIARVSIELSEIVIPELDTDALQAKIERLGVLNTVIEQQDDVKTREDSILSKIGCVDEELKKYNVELNELIDSTDDCPLCGQELSADCKHQLKGN